MLVLPNVSEASSAQAGEQVTVFTQLNRAYKGFTSSLLGMPEKVDNAIIAAAGDDDEVKRIWNEYTERLLSIHAKTYTK